MTCLRPFRIQTREGTKEVPCGHCVNCTIKKIQYNKYLAVKELEWCNSHNLGSSFIRLSYNDVFLPVVVNGKLYRLGELIDEKHNVPIYEPTLLKSDFIKFMKRLRKKIDNDFGIKVKYCYCGEYGEDEQGTHRSHYHLILFGLDSLIAKELVEKTWNYGFITSLPVKNGAVSYMCKYMFHDVYGEEKEQKYTSRGIEPPFYYHSINMGRYVILQDIQKDPEVSYINGKKIPYPKYIRDKYGASPYISKNKITREEQIRENLKKAENYVIQSRQSGIPIDSRSLYEKENVVDGLKINKLINEVKL